MEKTDSRKKEIKHFRDLEVYQKSFRLAMRIFQITKDLPSEERYALTDQIRRSSRAVCSNLAEAWRKRKYSAVFCNKLTDSRRLQKHKAGWNSAMLASILMKTCSRPWIKNMNRLLEC
ncbi:MAG TPA: four helix bundle protein [Syntrophales bacterium]